MPHTSLLLSLCVTLGSPDAATPASNLSELASIKYHLNPLAVEGAATLGMLAEEDEPAPATPAATDGRRIPAYGLEGDRRWHIHGGYGGSVQDKDDTFLLIGVGFDQFIADGLSLGLELNAMSFHQEIEDTEGLNACLMLRWHFIRQRRWTMFLDAGAGLLVSLNDVPAQGSSLNFTPQAGLGFTFDLGDDIRLLTGMRWHHTSNANLYRDNPGRDSFMGYVGLSFPF